MTQQRLIALAVLLGFLAILIQSTFIVVREDETALVLRFGEPVREYTEAGLKIKVPGIDNVTKYSKKNLELDQPVIQILASNRERLDVDSFARYRIEQPLAFYRTVRSIPGGEARLATNLERTLRQFLGEETVQNIISEERAAKSEQEEEESKKRYLSK